MIGGVNFYETFGDRWDYEAYNWAKNSSVDDNQKAFDLCLEFDILENELCSKLYEKILNAERNNKIVIMINIFVLSSCIIVYQQV